MLSENFSTLPLLGAMKIKFLIFLHFYLFKPNRQTYGKTIYRIDAICKTNQHKKMDLYINYSLRKSRFLLNLADIQTDRLKYL